MRLVTKISLLAAAAVFPHFAWAQSHHLDAVQQNPDPFFLDELAGRIGCDAAAPWMVLPAGGAENFVGTLSRMKSEAKARSGREDRARSWYALTKKYLFDQRAVLNECDPATRVRTFWDGLHQISNLAPEGLTIVALGGFGSHTASEGTLTTSYNQWKKQRRDLFDSGKVRFVRVECAFSYSPDESFCAKDMLATLERLDKQSSNPGKHKFLFWAYSKGGISAIEMLRLSADLRARTLAVVNVGSPVRGAMVMDRLAPALDSFVSSSRIPGTSETMGADTVMKMLHMWVGGARTDIDEIMRNFPKFREGAHALETSHRQRMIARVLTPNSHVRPDGSKIPVFQIAGLIDPGRLQALPKMTVRGGKLVATEGSSDGLHAAQMGAMIGAAERPLSDSCVALESALLPLREARASGLDPQLLAVLRMDHLSLRLHRMASERKHGVPDHAIVEATLSTIARRLKP